MNRHNKGNFVGRTSSHTYIPGSLFSPRPVAGKRKRETGKEKKRDSGNDLNPVKISTETFLWTFNVLIV